MNVQCINNNLNLRANSYPKRAEQRQERFYKTLVYFSSKYLPFHLLN